VIGHLHVGRSYYGAEHSRYGPLSSPLRGCEVCVFLFFFIYLFIYLSFFVGGRKSYEYVSVCRNLPTKLELGIDTVKPTVEKMGKQMLETGKSIGSSH